MTREIQPETPADGQKKARRLRKALRERDRAGLRRLLGAGGDSLDSPATILQLAAKRIPLPWLVHLQDDLCKLAGTNDGAMQRLAREWQVLAAWEPAEQVLRTVLARSPGNRHALCELLKVLELCAKSADAVELLEPALSLYPNDPELLLHLGQVEMLRGNIEPALAAFQLSEEAGGPLAAKAGQQFLLALAYLPDVTAADLLEAAAAWEQRHLRVAPRAREARQAVHRAGRRIRIGYYSPDLRRHSVSHFFLPLLSHHDKDRFECFIYNDTPFPDELTAQLREWADHWIELRKLDVVAAANRIAADQLDLLVDLAGHFGANRLEILAARPAPVQVHLLGYNGSTGLSFIDYRITDPVSDPPGSEHESTEALVRSGCGFHCYDPLVDPIDPGPPPIELLDHVTFGCFNSLPKLNDEVVALWAALLNAVPRARLLLKAIQLNDRAVCDALAGRFDTHGIDSARIDILPGSLTQSDHLRTYRRIDIALDPFPCNGTTTTCEALWMGVPVVTLQGQRHSARVTASLLTQIGLQEGIATTAEEYVRIAARWAAQPGWLAGTRQALRSRMECSPLMDPVRHAAAIEAAYIDMLESSDAPH